MLDNTRRCIPTIGRPRSLAAGLCSIAAAVLLSACGSTNHKASTTAAKEAPASTGFAVSRTPATPDDALPAEVATRLAESFKPKFTRADIRAARRVLAQTPAWLLPNGNGEVCLVHRVNSLVAATPDSAAASLYRHTCAPEGQAKQGSLSEVARWRRSVRRIRTRR